MINERVECIDAGSEYCPCYLAETNDCIMCAHLQGKNFCDCIWSGVCIYQEFHWCGNKKKYTREACEGRIIEKKHINKDVIILKIAVTKTLARQLKHPGSYIFIREQHKPLFFNVPMSIMDVDEYKGEIHIAIKILGIKTKALMECNKKIFVKGPYWNGVLGLKNLKNTKGENVLLVSRGIALAPSVLAIKYLLKNKNNITCVMDPGKIGTVFIKDYIKDLNIKAIQVNLREENGLNKFRSILMREKYDLVYSAGSDKFHSIIEKEVNVLNREVKFVITNNSKICCGEGVCGSCTCKTRDGNVLKMCKSQLGAKEVLDGRNFNG